MLRFPPILLGKRIWNRGFHRPSKIRFLRFRLHFQQEIVKIVFILPELPHIRPYGLTDGKNRVLPL